MRDQTEICDNRILLAEINRLKEREAATRSVLQVIGQSPSDVQPVFDVIAATAQRLCQAEKTVIWQIDSHGFKLAATIPNTVDRQRTLLENPITLNDDSVAGRALAQEGTLHIRDIKSDPVFSKLPLTRKTTTRTLMAVPLFDPKRAPLGVITLSRDEVREFEPENIALVETFAKQAVIAIENVRLFKELQTQLEREGATAEVLSVINQSRHDERPVFDVILANAARLCGVPTAYLTLVDDLKKDIFLAADWGPLKFFQTGRTRFPMESPLVAAQTVRHNKIIHIVDVIKTDLYQEGGPVRTALYDEEGIRSFLAVPLVNGDKAIGSIILCKREAIPFSADQIALIETFAAQAVIAIENVRQFKALESFNAELGDRVKRQVGEIERMGRLKRFLPVAVADTIVSSGSEAMLKSHRARLGVLFCDIRGFTAFCETAEPEETIEVLQIYHQEMGKLINEHGAGVDHRMGDGIMALFNDPIACEDPAGDAVRLAIVMQTRMVELCARWKRLGYRLGFGVGVSLGYATVGIVGFEGRYDYTASGTAINLASRLCDEAEDGEILLSPRAAIAVEGRFQIETRGEINLKGIREPMEVFKISANVDRI